MPSPKHLLTLCLAPIVLAPSLALAQAKNVAFIADLERRFGSRLIYLGDSNGRELVANFNIDCQAHDGRYLPLKNLLLVRISTEVPSAQLRNEIHTRGGDIRIVDVGRLTDGSVFRVNALQISKFGDVQPLSFSIDAVYNACFGSYGPIWMGGRP